MTLKVPPIRSLGPGYHRFDKDAGEIETQTGEVFPMAQRVQVLLVEATADDDGSVIQVVFRGLRPQRRWISASSKRTRMICPATMILQAEDRARMAEPSHSSQ